MSFVFPSAGHQLTNPDGGLAHGEGVAGIAGAILAGFCAVPEFCVTRGLGFFAENDFESVGWTRAPKAKIAVINMKSALRELLAPACFTRWRNIFIGGAPFPKTPTVRKFFVGFC